MKRKMKRKKYISSPLIIFTLETINIALEAIKRFELPLERVSPPDEKVTFAIEEMKRVKAKLEAMRAEAEAGHMRITAFDYNDKVLLITAIQMYSFDLSVQPASPRQVWELDQCRRIAAYLAPNRPNEQTESKKRL